MNEESADVKIKRIGDAFLMRNLLCNITKDRCLLGVQLSKKIGPTCSEKLCLRRTRKQELLLRTVDDVLRNREVMVEQLSPATPEKSGSKLYEK